MDTGAERAAPAVGLELPHAAASAEDFDEPDHMADAVGVTGGR